jgi:hypothetical protein
VAAWLETALIMVFFLIPVVDGDGEVRLRRPATSLSLFVQRLWHGFG